MSNIPPLLDESAQLIAATLSESSEAAFLLDTEGVVLYENPPAKRLIFETTEQHFDLSAGDPRHSYHFSFFFTFASPTHQPWQDYFDALLGQDDGRTFSVQDTGTHSDYEVVCKRTNGTEFPASLRLAKLDRQFLCAYVTPNVAFDRANNPFAREDHSLKCILNASFDPVFSIDDGGKILMVNDAAVAAFGYASAHELVGENVSIICGGGHADHHNRYIQRYMDSGHNHIIGTKRVVPAKRKDGTEFSVELGIKEVSCRDYGIPAGKAVFVAFLKDMSVQERHDVELEHKVALMQAMIDSSFDPMFQIDQRGIVQICNDAAVSLFGYARDELLGRNISIICGGDHASQHDQYLQHYLTTGAKRVIGRKRKVTARRKDGTEFEIELGVKEVAASNGERLFCGFVRDLSPMIMEKRRIRSMEQKKRDHFFGP